MTPDLRAIEELSTQFAHAGAKLPRVKNPNAPSYLQGIVFIPEELREQGMKVLRMFEAEVAKYPDDSDAKHGLAMHLYRMAVVELQGFYKQSSNVVADGNRICDFAYRSYQTAPTALAAMLLGDFFDHLGYFATAISWYERAEAAPSPDGDEARITKTKAKRLSLQADGKVSDPPLARGAQFPTRNTPGLELENQPATPPPAPAKGGCAGVLVIAVGTMVVAAYLSNC
jgi:hypothetical protein